MEAVGLQIEYGQTYLIDGKDEETIELERSTGGRRGERGFMVKESRQNRKMRRKEQEREEVRNMRNLSEIFLSLT